VAHAVFGADGDIVAAADEFPGGEVDGVALDDFLGQVLAGVFAGGGGGEAAAEERRGEAREALGEEGHCAVEEGGVVTARRGVGTVGRAIGNFCVPRKTRRQSQPI
jgi:hypothetical protein